jgi:hypothetical protein
MIIDSDIDEIYDNAKISVERLLGKQILITGAAGFLGRYFMSLFHLIRGMIWRIRLACHVSMEASMHYPRITIRRPLLWKWMDTLTPRGTFVQILNDMY